MYYNIIIFDVKSTKWFRLAPVLQTLISQCVILYTCSQSNSDGSVTESSELD